MIHPLDLVFFQGGEAVSRTITFLTKRQQRRAGRKLRYPWYSHVGMVISSDLYDDPRLQPGELYVLEATYTGKNDDGVPNIDNEPRLGVQIRPLRQLVRAYTDPNTNRAIAYSPMQNNPFASSGYAFAAERARLKFVFTAFCKHQWENTRYDANPISLLASMYTPLRPLRRLVERFVNTDEWLFCSELVAQVAKTLDLLPPTIEPRNVLPMDLLGHDLDTEADGGLPRDSRWDTIRLFNKF